MMRCRRTQPSSTASGTTPGALRGPLTSSVRHYRGAGHVPLVLLGERAVDLLQRVLVRDDLVPGIFRQRSQHEVERAAQVLGLVVGEADDAAVAEDDPRRIELGLPADVEVADLEIGPFG